MKRLYVIGNPGCRPCVQMKNEIGERIEELHKLECDFIYVSLNELEDKDSFIQAHKLTSTPTVWIEKDGQKLVQFEGYKKVDDLFKQIGGIK